MFQQKTVQKQHRAVLYTLWKTTPTQFHKWKGVLVPWVFSAVMGTADPGKVRRGLPWPLGEKKLLKAELWFWIPNQFCVNREAENLSTNKRKTLLVILIMSSFLCAVSLEDTLRPIQTYKKCSIQLLHCGCKYVTSGFTTLKGHNLICLLTLLSC